jgi:hypothetical protein
MVCKQKNLLYINEEIQRMVTYESDYQSKLPVIAAIPEDKLASPTMPVMEYMHAVHKLLDRCQDDKAELTAAGLDWDLVTDLSVRMGAYYKAECEWENVRKLREIFLRAQSLLDELSPVFRKAYRHDPGLLARVEHSIANNDCVNALDELSGLDGLGTEYPKPLLNNNFNAQYWARKVEFIRGEYKYRMRKAGDEKQRQRTRMIRDQAFTHLKEAVDHVCVHAQKAFQSNEARLKGYCATYFKSGYVRWKI